EFAHEEERGMASDSIDSSSKFSLTQLFWMDKMYEHYEELEPILLRSGAALYWVRAPSICCHVKPLIPVVQGTYASTFEHCSRLQMSEENLQELLFRRIHSVVLRLERRKVSKLTRKEVEIYREFLRKCSHLV